MDIKQQNTKLCLMFYMDKYKATGKSLVSVLSIEKY